MVLILLDFKSFNVKKSFKFNSFIEYLDCIVEESIQDRTYGNDIGKNISDYLINKFIQEIHKVKEFDLDENEEEEEEKEEKHKK